MDGSPTRLRFYRAVEWCWKNRRRCPDTVRDLIDEALEGIEGLTCSTCARGCCPVCPSRPELVEEHP